MDTRIYDWLMEHADLPIRYRVLKELSGETREAEKIHPVLIRHPAVLLWLKNLKPESPPQNRWMEHGSFDFNLENALLKAIRLGLSADEPQLRDAAASYVKKIENTPMEMPVRGGGFREGLDRIIICSLLSLAGTKHDAIRRFMASSLHELYEFTKEGNYDIYYTEDEKRQIRNIPKIWRDRKVIRRSLCPARGFCYPLIYDIIGLHTLYDWNDRETTRKINAVIDYITTELFHRTVADGYGLVSLNDGKCYAMGWDPKYPGWFDAGGYIATQNASKLLFFAEHASHYPAAGKTKWFAQLLSCLEQYRTDRGTYIFPAGWMKERRGYAVLGSHLSYGENRRKKNWLEIESTFYMLLLKSGYAKAQC